MFINLSFFIAFVALIYSAFQTRGNLKVGKAQFNSLLYIAITGTIIAELLYLYAISKIPVINAVLISHLQPIFIIFMGYLFLFSY